MNKQEIEKAIEQLKGDILHHEAIMARNTEYPEYCKGEQLYIDALNLAISALEHQLTAEYTASEFLSKAKEINDVEAQKKDEFCKTIFTIIDYITGANDETSEAIIHNVMDYKE